MTMRVGDIVETAPIGDLPGGKRAHVLRELYEDFNVLGEKWRDGVCLCGVGGHLIPAQTNKPKCNTCLRILGSILENFRNSYGRN